MRKFLFFLALIVAQCAGQWSSQKASWNKLEFTNIGGVIPDPCHIGLTDQYDGTTKAVSHDCTFNEFPDASHTLVVPTATSFLGAKIVTYAISVAGHYFTNGGRNPSIMFGLSTIAGRCSSIDRVITYAPATGPLPAGIPTDTEATFTTPAPWYTTSMEFESRPRSLCFGYGTVAAPPTEWFYTGVKWKVNWVTPAAGTSTCPPPVDNPDTQIGVKVRVTEPQYTQWPMNATLIAQRKAMVSTCVLGNAVAGGLSQCFNPNVMACCNNVLYSKQTQKCCASGGNGAAVVQWMDAPCPCASNNDCPTFEATCCLPKKYPELLTITGLNPPYLPIGQCYNGSVHFCCDTGRRYDPGSDQCCAINGVQSLDIPCPCNNQRDCLDPVNPKLRPNVDCCRQYAPIPWESTLYGESVCSKYANFPNGTGHYSVQPCLGNCISTDYQICCNGVACLKTVEYCCNSTCCNKYVGTCHRGLRSGSPGNWVNNNDFGVYFMQCTTIEQLNTVRAFWIFVLPTELMFASFFGLALCLAVAAKASEGRTYSILERIMLGAAILCVLFAITHFFAPIYKYGVVVVCVSLLAIITSAVRVRWLTIMCIFFQLVAIVYLFDFVDGNYYLELNSNRDFVMGTTDPQTMGVLHSIKKMWPSPTLVGTFLDLNNPDTAVQPLAFTDARTQRGWCTSYYKYFSWDPQMHDTQRVENPAVTTFGYCSRAWATALYLFTAAIMDLVILQLIVDILALLFRFQETSYVPNPLESAEQ